MSGLRVEEVFATPTSESPKALRFWSGMDQCGAKSGWHKHPRAQNSLATWGFRILGFEAISFFRSVVLGEGRHPTSLGFRV